ncbi:DUF5681 domain-containing protein [Halomonas piscis]|uniref:DUF5681 domain-containing protein n=1 Tax=Halomonas piscis TaxID=3031727 RepID=A0ABY9YWV8_9GAMM|nr:DUF5681 domain-containing protein [Halomonas piscis]WNK19364.1 DUF5681 domain-containing protein [Halomonas piscis]
MSKTQIERGDGGKWKSGQSGNPKGRPPKATQELQRLIGSRQPELIERTIQMALDGDMAAMKLLLERVLPPLKASAAPVSIELPEGGSLADNAKAILSAAANGQVPGDVASQLISAIGATAKVVEIDEISERLEALEAAAHEQE